MSFCLLQKAAKNINTPRTVQTSKKIVSYAFTVVPHMPTCTYCCSSAKDDSQP